MPGAAGRSTAGTAWTSTDQRGAPLYGTLRVPESTPELFRLRFTVISHNPANWSDGSRTVVYTP